MVNRNWFIEDTEEVDLSTNVYTWVDYNATNDTSRFYTCWTLYDTDGDGISDGRETLLYGTSITNSDTDGDGTYDIVEIYYGFDPKAYTPPDWDNDGLSNNFEYYCTNSISTNGIERLNAKLFDSDGDKLPDLFEVMYTNFNPCVSNSFEGESLFGDPDEDELNNAEEMQYGTNPWLFDTDGDSTNDYDEVHFNHTDPLDSNNEYAETVVNCIMELSAVDDNDYMLMIMGSSSTNIFLTSYTNNILFTNKICSIGQPLNVELSRNLEVESNYSPELTESDVAFRVYTMDPWVITCYGWYYPYLGNSQFKESSSSTSPLTMTTTSSPLTMETTAGGGGVDVSFYIPTMTVDIGSLYDGYYYYILCGCNNLYGDLNVNAKVSIGSPALLYGTTPYIFNPEPITCTATGSGSVFQQDSDVDTIDFGSTIIGSPIIGLQDAFKYASFSLDTGVDSLTTLDHAGYYQYNISVEATEEKMEPDSDDIDVSIYVAYSHGTWIIDSEMCPENVINILNSPNASVNIDFLHSVCANYGLNGTLDITPDGNTDIFTLGDISREIDIEESPYSTSEGFSVIGCSDDLGDMIVDLEFSGDEYHSASYSLTSCALVVSNQSDNISMFTGLEDADNDGTNNVNDLDNAGDFMPFLVKTHESATNAFFRLEFDENKLNIWTKDSNAMITRTNSYIPNGNRLQAYHNYSYDDIFEEGAEKTLYVQGLQPGVHSVGITYLLDNYELDSEDVSFSFISIGMTAYRPQTEGVGYGNPFQKHAVPDDQEENPGTGIRVNGDTETGANENDFIEVELKIESYPAPAGLAYILKRNNTNIKVWDSQSMGNAILDSGTEATVTFSSDTKTVWVENPDGGTADLEFVARVGSIDVDSDKIHFYPFTSVVIVLGGEGQNPDDPVNDPGNHGTFEIAIDLYQQGYDVHMYNEDVVASEDRGGVAYEEVENAVNNRNVTQIAVFGYSHGGGSTYDLAVNLNNHEYTITYAAYIDAVKQPLAEQENRRPPGTAFLGNYYQNNGVLELGGGPVPGADFELDVTTTAWGANLEHGNIDDHLNVINGVINQLIGHVNP
ncbi:MAG: hypothetical protein PF692_15690 [Kiritimatiellae bacterium]|nr:hypothetical protein [Kiritimatiellia bacterium]